MRLMLADERRARLDQAMGVYGVRGHITPAGPYQFQVSVEGSTVPHVLYLLLSILTCGLWLIVWLIHVSMQKAPSLHVVRVDEYGAVWFDGTVWWPPPAGDGPQQLPPAHT